MPRLARLCGFGVVCALVVGAWVTSWGVPPAESGGMGEPKERWIYTTKGHFSWYGLLAFAPIYRDQIRSVLLGPDRVYLGVELLDDVQFIALDRGRGHRVWERHLPFNGRPTGRRFVEVGGRLVAALYEFQKKELVILGMNPADGTVLWTVSLPGVQQPAVWEEILDAAPTGDTVTVFLPRLKEQNLVVLRVTDGHRLAEASYNGYLWPLGARRARGLIFGYNGVPSERVYDRLLAFHEGTGQLAWTLPLSPRRASPPTVVEDSLLIISGDQLLRVDLKTGRPRWTVNLGGRPPVDPDPPLVIGPRIAVTHAATPDPDDRQWKLSIHRLTDGGMEADVTLRLGEFGMPSALRRMGDLVIIVSGLALQVADPQGARILATLDLEKLLSWFVYADPPSRQVADSDAQGFVVVTSDGRLRYFAAEDFRSPVPPAAR